MSDAPHFVARSSSRFLLGLFASATFASALLLFLVQPMFAKQVLPLLGGTSAVWNTSMLFFQAMLLAGYLYAHLSTRWLGVRRQARVHLVLAACSLLALPIGASRGWSPPVEISPVPWLLLLLAVSIGFPFFVLSSSSPLLQKWFSETGHQDASNPYFLYAASNLGSFAALLGYPLLVEPALRLTQQNWVWSIGYGCLVALLGGCALLLVRRRSPAVALNAGVDPVAPHAYPSETPVVSNARRGFWVLLSFAPSSLLLGVTQYLTTDIAAIPLLWILPLALYLLTFVIVFARHPVLRHEAVVRLQPRVVVPLVVLMAWGFAKPIWVFFPLHLAVFFITALVCHGELAKRRPPVSHLTEFYLWVSVGGVLGGVFNVLVAPAVFDTVLEYPLALALACALRPRLVPDHPRERRLDLVLPAVLGLMLVSLLFGWGGHPLALEKPAVAIVVAVVSVVVARLCLRFSSRPVRFGLAIGVVLLVGAQAEALRNGYFHVERTFFGVHRVKRDAEQGYQMLVHGTTLHGGQSLAPHRRLEPLTYYGTDGPLGQVFAALEPPPGRRRVAVVGLGTGTIACYGAPGEQWRYYEIDPAVERIARDPRYFTYLRDCPPSVEVVLGDARQSLMDAPDQQYDLIVLDAFSSDAIPVHLLTREALALYLAKLAPGGLLAFHISNLHLDLEPVLAKLAADAGPTARIRPDVAVTAERSAALKSPSTWVVLARREADLRSLVNDPRWRSLTRAEEARIWTDNYSDILSVLRGR